MKAITLWQPWASLIAEGVKRIETRSWPAPAALVGERIAIHAAAKKPAPWDLWVGGFRCGIYSDGSTYMVPPNGSTLGPIVELPLGAVVATAQLTACVPMVADYDDVTGVYEGPAALELGEAHNGVGWATLYPEWGGALDEDEMVNVSDQLPYGDFAPGRWAWILDDVERLAEPIPAKGRQKVWEWTP